MERHAPRFAAFRSFLFVHVLRHALFAQFHPIAVLVRNLRTQRRVNNRLIKIVFPRLVFEANRAVRFNDADLIRLQRRTVANSQSTRIRISDEFSKLKKRGYLVYFLGKKNKQTELFVLVGADTVIDSPAMGGGGADPSSGSSTSTSSEEPP